MVALSRKSTSLSATFLAVRDAILARARKGRGGPRWRSACALGDVCGLVSFYGLRLRGRERRDSARWALASCRGRATISVRVLRFRATNDDKPQSYAKGAAHGLHAT
jgi:hypothetical protein